MIVSSAFQHLLADSNDEMSKAARVKSVGFNVLESNGLEKGGLTFLLEQKLFVKGKLMVMIVKPPGGNFKQQQQKSSVVRVQLGPIFPFLGISSSSCLRMTFLGSLSHCVRLR